MKKNLQNVTEFFLSSVRRGALVVFHLTRFGCLIFFHLTAINLQKSREITLQIQQWGFPQCLPFSWKTLRDKHCRHPIAVMGVVDTFRQQLEFY